MSKTAWNFSELCILQCRYCISLHLQLRINQFIWLLVMRTGRNGDDKLQVGCCREALKMQKTMITQPSVAIPDPSYNTIGPSIIKYLYFRYRQDKLQILSKNITQTTALLDVCYTCDPFPLLQTTVADSQQFGMHSQPSSFMLSMRTIWTFELIVLNNDFSMIHN